MMRMDEDNIWREKYRELRRQERNNELMIYISWAITFMMTIAFILAAY